MPTDVRNTGNNGDAAAAAAAAARQAAEAAEAARRAAAAAAAARQAAEAAQAAAEAARSRAASAGKNVGQTRRELAQGEQQLQGAKPEQREGLKKNVDRMRGEVDGAKTELKTANRA